MRCPSARGRLKGVRFAVDTLHVRDRVLNRGYLSAAAAAATVAVLILVALADAPGLGLSHLFYLPIALFALAGGLRVGLFAGTSAVVLWAAGAQIADVEPTPAALAMRAIGFVTIGGLIGWYVSGHRKLVRTLDRLAVTDELTGAGNTRACAAAVAERVAAGEPFGMVICDVDGLKGLNDSGGHQRGDWAILAVAAALGDFVRGSDDVFRVGGDEFAALLSLGDRASLERIAERLSAAIEGRGASASFGIALFPADARTAAGLKAMADSRMYEHKFRNRASPNAGPLARAPVVVSTEAAAS